MDTNTLARLTSLLKDVYSLQDGPQILEKKDLRSISDHLRETIEGDYAYVGEAMKETKAFEAKKGICYIPEASDHAYTYFDIAAITGDNHKITKRVFQLCEWQHPETIFEEGIREGEWDEHGEILIK